MKLIDILVDAGDETPLFGVHTKYLAMDPDGRVHGYCDMPSTTVLGWGIPDALYSTDGRGCLIQLDRDDVDGQWQSAIITREQYEAALAAKNEGWIEWGGGECPLHHGVIIDAKDRDGYIHHGEVVGESIYIDDIFWRRGVCALEDNEIIAYRLHKPQETEQAEADDEADLNECIGQDAAPVWNGEGLPPVGMEIEYRFAKANYRTDFSRGKVLAYGMQNVFMEHWASKNEFIQPLDKIEFRPFRSEADRKREEAVKTIMLTGWCQASAEEIYDLVAAGKLPGVKLED